MKTIGGRIRRLREEKDWSQKELAIRTSINNSVLSRIEANKRPVEDELIVRFAEIFNTTTDYLLGRTDNPNPHPQNSSSIKDQPIAFAANGDINVEELEKIINRAVKKALREREKYGDNN